MTFHESPPPGTPRWLSTPLITVAALLVLVLAAFLVDIFRHTDEPPTTTTTAVVAPSQTSTPPVAVVATSEPYDAAAHQDPEKGDLPRTTASQRNACAVPSQSLIDRVLYKMPIDGAGPSVQRAVTLEDQGETFVAVVSDVGTGTWVINGSQGSVLALDQDAADISGYALTTTDQHDLVDADNYGRGILLSCIAQGFPGDTRQAG